MQQKSPAAQTRKRAVPEELLLAVVALGLGLACAIGYAVWQATRATAGAWSEFASTMLFPGTLILAAVAAMVWLGWKANIDD